MMQKGIVMAFDFTTAHGRYLPFIRLVVSSYPERYRDDLTQEGSWGLYLGCCAFDPDRGVPFDAYIKVCIRNRIRSAAREYASDSNLVPLEDVGETLPATDLPIEERYAESDAARKAFKDLQPRLSSLERQVLEQYLSGNTLSEIARTLQVSTKSVDNAMTRIKKKIRDHIPY
ncbi:MAG: sigma-70 family RNA polymerase sigma factor [Clostridia bacterium]|nr:sigma-70 family RNA polymerase sigma factor [Clostridia bacterium]